MQRIGYFVIGAMVTVAGSAFAADTASSAAHGKQLFLRDGCWECHGTMGQGGAAGKTLAPNTLPLEAMINFVHTTTGQMPAYSDKVLSDADLADIHAYLVSLPKPPSPDSIPALKNLKETK
jgi:ubiquinol-cytochrome c reductase cytochrome c subunit